jgi:hypothetical protein
MRPADNINELIKKLKLKASTDLDRRVHDDISMALAESDKIKSAITQPYIGRTIMKSPITKLAAAAVIIISCVIGLSLWRNTGSGIALADVLARVEQVKAVRYKWTWQGEPNKPYDFERFELRATCLDSREYGKKGKVEALDPNGGWRPAAEKYNLPQKKIRIIIRPTPKIYMREELKDASVEEIQKASFEIGVYSFERDPLSLLKRILKTKYESLGKSTVDGIEVAGFRSTDPNLWGGKNQKTDHKIWVDVKTLLPVRYDVLGSIGYVDELGDRQHFVMHDFQWDVSVDPAEFEPPPIPDGYKIRDMFPDLTNEENAIGGLKQCVELLGNYPERIYLTYLWTAFEKSETAAVLRLKEELKGLTGIERDNKKMDSLKPMRFLIKFYIGLSKMDSAYYGKTVTPKDTDKVLLRWKLSENEFRVIYGDLHGETVAAEKLAELEKAMPE